MIGVVVASGPWFLGTAVCFGITLEIHRSCQPFEEGHVVAEAHVAKDGPLFRRQRYHHPSIHLPDLTSHEVAREVVLHFLHAMLRTHHCLDRALQVVRHQRHAEHEQRRLWIAQRVDLAIQRRRQVLEPAFDCPPLPVRLRHHDRRHLPGQVAQNGQLPVAIFRRLLQFHDDSTQLVFLPLLVFDEDDLLEDFPGLASASPPQLVCHFVLEAGMLADDEETVPGRDAQQKTLEAEIAIGDPKRAFLDQGEDGIDQGALWA